MRAEQSPDAIDARLVLRVYAVLTLAAGLAVYSWPTLLPDAGFPDATPPHPWPLTRSAAGLVAGVGACAAGLAGLGDPLSRVLALRAFAVAHIVFGTLFFLQWQVILEALLPASVGLAPLIAGFVLFSLSATQGSDPGGPTLDELRSQYEEQIGEAARQEERARLARDLHDAVKQQLFAIQASAATVEARFDGDPSGAQAALAQVRASAREATTEMEALIEQLQTQPLETSGLREALKRQCEALAFRTGADVQLVVGDVPPDAWLPPGTQRALFRGAQEALANVGRHARAAQVTVRLGTEGNRLVLAIRDDGAGFDPATGRTGMGLENMKERARALGGTFLLTTAPGEGTTARFIIPVRRQTTWLYAARVLVWTSVLAMGVILNWPIGAMAAAVLAIAVLVIVRSIIAIIKLRRAGATWL